MDAKTPPWPADKVQRRAIRGLLPYARNPRMHSPEQITQLAKAITEYGWTVPCLVDEEGTLIAGHGRVLAAEQLGLDAVPVVVAKGWSDDRKRAYRIWDNQSVLLGTWNTELLSAELRELVSAGADMELIGFPEAELVQFMAHGEANPPDDFKQFSEDIDVEHCCPKCGYSWSGRPDAGRQKEKT